MSRFGTVVDTWFGRLSRSAANESGFDNRYVIELSGRSRLDLICRFRYSMSSLFGGNFYQCVFYEYLFSEWKGVGGWTQMARC